MHLPVRLEIEGGDAASHTLPAYDGFVSLAGFAWTLSLMSQYIENGVIRHRGHFPGRDAVKAEALKPGSVISDFIILVSDKPYIASAMGLGSSVATGVVANFCYDLLKRTIDRNLGRETDPQTAELKTLETRKGGDLEALVAAVEPAIRQSHMMVGAGATVINVLGGTNHIGRFDKGSKEYVVQTVEDREIKEKDLSVASFNTNSGHGSVYDPDLGRTIPMKLNKDTLRSAGSVLSWGLHEYASGTGKKVLLKYWRLLSLDGTPKKYVIVEARIPLDSKKSATSV